MRHCLSSLALAGFVAACGGSAPVDLSDIEKRLPRREMDAPSDLPDWSESKYVRWSSVKVSGERALIIDIGGGAIDKLLDDERVSELLNHEYRAIFLHPRARPSLTGRLGWPSLTLFDEQGCVRATGQPTTVEGLVALLKEGLEARKADVEKPLPAWRQDVPEPPEGGGVWTADQPEAAAMFTNPERGAPAVIVDGKPYVYGNRSDAELFRKQRPAADAFLEMLPENHSYLASEGPVLKCPLPPPPPPSPAPAEEDEGGQAEPASGG